MLVFDPLKLENYRQPLSGI